MFALKGSRYAPEAPPVITSRNINPMLITA